MTALEMVREAAAALDGKKAKNVRAIGIHELSVITDYFVIASGTSSTHVHALADEVEFRLGQKDVHPDRVEGSNTDNWVLLDYGTVIVHVFQDKTREFYDLERLWKDGEEVLLSDVLQQD